jgi:hypothetical protein
VNDLAIGLIVLMLAAAPASLLVLVFADVIRLPESWKRGWIIAIGSVLALPAVVSAGFSLWGWAGAAHLGPLCAAYATPSLPSSPPVAGRVAQLDIEPAAATLPLWSAALLAAGGPLDSLEAGAPVTLEMRRVTHHQNRWFTVQMDRFRIIDRDFGTVRGEADELWIRAGRQTWHCGVESGPEPTRTTRYPGGSGVARFVLRALRGPQPGDRAPR